MPEWLQMLPQRWELSYFCFGSLFFWVIWLFMDLPHFSRLPCSPFFLNFLFLSFLTLSLFSLSPLLLTFSLSPFLPHSPFSPSPFSISPPLLSLPFSLSPPFWFYLNFCSRTMLGHQINKSILHGFWSKLFWSLLNPFESKSIWEMRGERKGESWICEYIFFFFFWESSS